METTWVAAEMAGAQLGDPRQQRSMVAITAALAARTDLSLTAACGPALRQAAHRLFEHADTSVAGWLAGHYAATAQRCAELPFVLIAQDTPPSLTSSPNCGASSGSTACPRWAGWPGWPGTRRSR